MIKASTFLRDLYPASDSLTNQVGIFFAQPQHPFGFRIADDTYVRKGEELAKALIAIPLAKKEIHSFKNQLLEFAVHDFDDSSQARTEDLWSVAQHLFHPDHLSYLDKVDVALLMNAIENHLYSVAQEKYTRSNRKESIQNLRNLYDSTILKLIQQYEKKGISLDELQCQHSATGQLIQEKVNDQKVMGIVDSNRVPSKSESATTSEPKTGRLGFYV